MFHSYALSQATLECMCQTCIKNHKATGVQSDIVQTTGTKSRIVQSIGSESRIFEIK